MAKRKSKKEIAEIVAKIRELGLTYAEGARRFGIKPWLIYDYTRKENGNGTVPEPSKKEGADEKKEIGDGPGGLPDEVGELIRRYRRDEPSHGFKKIQDLLKEKYLIVVTRKQIRRVLKEAGLLETCDSSFDKAKDPPKGTRRFEAKRPGELWQMDVTYVYIQKIPVLYLVTILDDHSRFCVAAELCWDQCADTMIRVLHDAVSVHGKPVKLLTDQGPMFYSWSQEETRFQEYLDDQEIEHIVSEPHSPTTAGKIERFIQTIKKELLRKVKFAGFEDAKAQIRSFVERYNVDRPNQGIQGKRPADRFHEVVGEVERAESKLAGPDLDLSRSYVVMKVQEHRVCVISAAGGLQVYLDGKLLRQTDEDGSKR